MDNTAGPSSSHEIQIVNHTGAGSWGSLPAEIRLLILETITTVKHRGWSSHAAVCREWQHSIAKKNFSHLELTNSCLESFKYKVVRQREYVKHIWLNIELPRYYCAHCWRSPPTGGDSRFRDILEGAIFYLFSVLSTWRHKTGIKLELNAYCPSDAEHWFKNHRVEPSYDDGNHVVSGSESLIQSVGWHDPCHGWISGHQVLLPGLGSIRRGFGEIPLLFPGGLPLVNAVTTFTIRRQLRRWFRPESIQRVLEKLPQLEYLFYEMWSARTYSHEDYYYIKLKDMWESCTFNNLKGLLLFEDVDPYYTPVLASWHREKTFMETVASNLAATFALASLDLKEISISFLVDASYFFRSLDTAWTWHSLETLALTSTLLNHRSDRGARSAMFHKAASVALGMPRLKTMVLWWGGKNQACAFIYQRHLGMCSLTWRATWQLELEPHVVEAWELVASEYGLFQLRISTELLTRDGILSHGDAIHRLNLPCTVVDPVSLRQIRREGLDRLRLQNFSY